MDTKKIINNVFLILYPFILPITMLYSSLLNDQINNNNINIFQLIFFLLVYFLIFSLFIFVYFIKKEGFYKVSLIVGIIELILLQIPQILLKISFKLYSIIYGQIQLNIFITGTLLTLYIINFIMNYKKKDSIEARG